MRTLIRAAAFLLVVLTVACGSAPELPAPAPDTAPEKPASACDAGRECTDASSPPPDPTGTADAQKP